MQTLNGHLRTWLTRFAILWVVVGMQNCSSETESGKAPREKRTGSVEKAPAAKEAPSTVVHGEVTGKKKEASKSQDETDTPTTETAKQDDVPEPVPGGPSAPLPNPQDPPKLPSPNEPDPPPPGGDPILSLHQPSPTSCVGCHEKKRPSATHYAGNDCVSCHKYPSFKGGAFLHDPKPTTCESCHNRPTKVGLRAYPNQGPPANFNPNDPTTPGAAHYRGKDCVQCHRTPKEGATAFVFAHSTPSPEACLPCHFNQGRGEHQGDQDIMLNGFGNCFNCHKNFGAKNFNRR